NQRRKRTPQDTLCSRVEVGNAVALIQHDHGIAQVFDYGMAGHWRKIQQTIAKETPGQRQASDGKPQRGEVQSREWTQASDREYASYPRHDGSDEQSADLSAIQGCRAYKRLDAHTDQQGP